MKSLRAMSAVSGMAMFLFFVLFTIAGRDVPSAEVHYPLIMNVCGFVMVAAASACATTSILIWLAERRGA